MIKTSIIDDFFSENKSETEITRLNGFLSQRRKSFSDPRATGVTKELEDYLKEYFDVKYAIAMNSGTSAIQSAYSSLSIKKGDEVIVPSYVFYGSVLSLSQFGVKVIPVPIKRETLNLDSSLLEKYISNKTRAILDVSMSGIFSSSKEIKDIANKYDISVIQDFSRCYQPKKIKLQGDLICYSMQDSKAVSAVEGGFLLTNSKDLFERAVIYSQPGRINNDVGSLTLRKFAEGGVGNKFRINPLGAILAIEEFQVLESRINMSNQNYLQFNNMISSFPFFESLSNFTQRGAWKHGYAIFSQNTDEMFKNQLVSKLQHEGIPVYREYNDCWIENLPQIRISKNDLSTSFDIFNSLLVFPGICSYSKNNSQVLSLYGSSLKKIYKEIRR